MKTCKYCKKQVSAGHQCNSQGRWIPYENNDGDFLTSMVIGEVTDNAIIGGLLGGDMLGGIVGQEIADSFDSSNDSSSDSGF